MASKLITTHELTGVRVVGGKNGTKRIGKVRRFVFHPKEKRCVGFIVKRPDLLWMFRRKDKFVSIEGYDIVDGRIAIRNVPEATDRAACKALGVNWDDCVLWVGLPVMTEDGTSLGMVGNVTFNRITGMVDTFDTDSGATANALPGMLPPEVREERRARFMEVAEAVSTEKLRERVGATMQVLVDSAPALGRRGGVGRSYADAPEIDGTVQLLPPEKISKQLKVGEFTKARIVGVQGHDLVAQPI